MNPFTFLSRMLICFAVLGICFLPGRLLAQCPTSAEVFINEFHYDNAGTDAGEFIEVAVLNSASVTLSDITVWLYNGNNGQTYGSNLLSNLTVGTNDGTYTYYSWNSPSGGIQNGDPDGFALSCGGVAFSFISYEGTFLANNGPAIGQTSVDIGAAQTNTNTPPVGSSLQKIGSTWYSVCGQNTNGNTNLLPSIEIAATDAVKAEGNAGNTPFTFTITRSGLTAGATTINYAVTGSGADPAAADDFAGGMLPSGNVSFIAGETSKTITINVAGDISVEPDEQFTVTITNAVSCYTQITVPAADGTILNDDAAGGTFIAIAATDAVKPEGNAGTTAFTFTVSRTGDVSGTSSVDYAVTGSGADPSDANDFGGMLPSGSVNFMAMEISKVITIDVSGDLLAEPDEEFTVTLSNPVGATITTATASGTILDDDTPTLLAISATSAVKNEGNSGFTAFTFTVNRTGNVSGTASVDYAVNGSGANPADVNDFGGTFPSGTVSFMPLETSQVITVNVSGDADVEPDEQFTVTLSNPINANIGVAAANGTILNDDILCPNASQVFINEFHYDNDGGDVGEFIEVAVSNSFPVTLSAITVWLYNGSGGGTYSPTSIALSAMVAGTNDGTYTYYSWNLPANGIQNGSPDGFALACGGTAFEFISYEGTFTATTGPASGQTSVDVGVFQPTTTPLGSSIQKIGSSWYATCGQHTNGNTNALPIISIAATDADKQEGNSGNTDFTFTVNRSGLTSGPTTLNYAVTGSGANPADAGDFGGTLPSGMINFLAGETSKIVTIQVSGDTDVEPDEEFTVTLTDVTNCNTDLATASATGTIRDDDGATSCPSTLHVSGTIASGIYKAADEVTSDGNVPMGNTVSFRAGTSITLQPNFEVNIGGELETVIETCVPFAPEVGAGGF